MSSRNGVRIGGCVHPIQGLTREAFVTCVGLISDAMGKYFDKRTYDRSHVSKVWQEIEKQKKQP